MSDFCLRLSVYDSVIYIYVMSCLLCSEINLELCYLFASTECKLFHFHFKAGQLMPPVANNNNNNNNKFV